MSKLMVSVSGIRGIVGDNLTPDVITDYTAAVAELLGKGTIVVGRDSRNTGEMVENIVTGTLLSLGCKVIQLGIVPTPTVELMVVRKKASGGIIITASHNPPEWNALKFLGNDGMFLRKENLTRLNELLEKKEWSRVGYLEVQPVETDNSGIPYHLEKVLSASFLDTEKVKQRKFKVVLDSNHGTGGPIGKELLEKLGCDVEVIGYETSGQFAHPCEPVPANLKMLGDKVREIGADIGFASDPDGDRVAIVSEKGDPIGEEYTLAIAVKCILGKQKGPIAMNLSTSKMAEDIATAAGCKTFRTPVGEINVSSVMKQENCVIGGEGNGGAMLPDVLYGRDAFGGMAVCLQYLAESGQTVSEAVASLPSYTMLKDKVELGTINAEAALEKIEKSLPAGEVSKVDGLRIAWDDSWAHVRKSNTEPIIRAIVEAKKKEDAEKLLEGIRKIIS